MTIFPFAFSFYNDYLYQKETFDYCVILCKSNSPEGLVLINEFITDPDIAYSDFMDFMEEIEGLYGTLDFSGDGLFLATYTSCEVEKDVRIDFIEAVRTYLGSNGLTVSPAHWKHDLAEDSAYDDAALLEGIMTSEEIKETESYIDSKRI